MESINRTTPNTAVTNANSISFTATFSEPVTGVTQSSFALVETGTIGATGFTVTTVSASVYTVTVNGIVGNGTIGVNLVDNNTIHDQTGNSLINPTAPVSFANQATYAIGTAPVFVTLGDLNGDGKPDLVVVNRAYSGYTNYSVGVLLGNGNGTFQSQQTFATGPTPNSVALGDVNGDGKPDMVVANDGSNTVSVLLGNGNGTFQSQQTFDAGTRPYSVKLGNINGDGKLDLVVANNGSDTVSVLLGNGNGTFQSPQTLATGKYPVSVKLGDVNGDGKQDLVVANMYDSTVSVLLGNGNGTFQSQQTFATGKYPISVTFGDLNGDGKQDLVVANYKNDSVSVLLGNGNGTFQSQQTFATGSGPNSVTLGDLNGDGNLDLVITNYNGTTVSVLLGNGNGTFQLQQAIATGSEPYSVKVGDVNGDGKPDLAVTNFADSTASVLLNNANGNFTGQTYTEDQIAPTVLSITATTASPATGSSAQFTVTFSESVTGVTTSAFDLTESGITGGTVSSISGSGTTYTVSVTGLSGSGTVALNLTSVTGIADLATNALAAGFTSNPLAYPSVVTFLQTGALVQLSGSQLIVSGTNGNDTLAISEGTSLVVTLNGINYVFNPTTVTAIDSTASTGNDTTNVSSLTAGTTFSSTSGSGNDAVTINASVTSAITLVGGTGNDTLTGGSGNNVISTGSGANKVVLVAPTIASAKDTLTSSGFANVLNLQAFTDGLTFSLAKGSGTAQTADTNDGFLLDIQNNAFKSVLLGGNAGTTNVVTGNTTLSTKIVGGSGDNTIAGGAGNDLIIGGLGNNLLTDGNGSDTLYGGNANNTLIAGKGSDTLYGGTANNVISTGTGANKVILAVPTISNAKDTLTSSGSANVLNLQAFTDGLTFSLAKGSGVAQTADLNNSFQLDVQNNAFKSVILGGNAGTTNVVTGNTTLATKIVGGSGDNTIAGGAGNDLLIGGLGNNLLTDGNGSDTLYGGNANNTLIAGKGSDTLYGGTANNVISTGTGANKVILAVPTIANAKDTLKSSGSTNVLNIQAFTDGLTFSLAKGSGVAQTADPNNSFQLDVQNNSFKSVLLGGNSGTTNVVTGNTTLGTKIVSGRGNNTLTGGSGNDFLIGGLGNSLLTDGNGADTLAGGSGNSTLNGGSGGDLFITGGTSNVISAGTGANRIQISVPTVANSKDTITDASTADLLNISAFTDGLTFSLAKGSGVAQVADPATGFTLDVPNGAFNNVLLGGSAGTTNFVTGNSTLGTKIVGGSGNNTITGGSGNDFLVGGLGNSLLTDGSGADSLIGGAGNSTLSSGNGGDTFVTGEASNVVAAGSGSNRMIVSIPEFANSKDAITDSSTNDILYLNAFTDGLTFSLAKGSGVAQLADPNNGFTLDLPDGAFFYVLLGGVAGTTNVVTGNSVAATRIYGGNNNNTITGGSGADYLTGGLGNCLLTDSAGNASLFGGGGNSTLIGGSGNDTLVAGLGTNVMTAGNGNDIFYAGIGNTTMTGGSGNDTFYGSSGNVTMSGGSGGDLFVSGTANNVISGGNGKNRIVLSVPTVANSKDTITDASTADILNLTAFTDGLTFRLANGSGIAQVADPNNGFTLDVPDGAFNDVLLGGSALTTNEVIGNSTLGTAIYGGAGNNILVGGNGNDSLYGGAGRDILVGGGGLGMDLLQSGVGGQDILIDGTVNFANPMTSLMAIENEWSSTDSYANRIADIRASGNPGLNLNGSNNLTISGGTPTITLGTTSNQMLGGGSNDWFWDNANDATNWVAGETLN